MAPASRTPALGTDDPSCYVVVMREPDAILHDALELPEDERARLALRLAESLEPAPAPQAADAWASEVARRIQRLRDGTALTVTSDDALARARARLRRD